MHAFLLAHYRIIQGNETGLAQVLMKHYRFWYHDKMHETSQVRFLVGDGLEIPQNPRESASACKCAFDRTSFVRCNHLYCCRLTQRRSLNLFFLIPIVE